jgi:glycine cleavage system aminomethyltransferase T
MAAYWSPIAAAEHVATRTAAGLVDMSTFTKIDISGPGALAALQHVSCTEQDRPVGRATYSLMLNEKGGIESDVVVARLGAESFRIFSGAGSGPRDLAWLRRATRDLAGVRIDDVTSATCALGLWGPHAAEILAPIADPAGVLDAFPRFGVREGWVGGVPCRLIRMSYVGEEGWEVHAPVEYGAALWEALMAAGAPHGLVAVGGAAMDTLRLEVGMRGLGTDLRAELTPAEAGLGFTVAAGKSGYIGHVALQTRVARRTLATLALDDATEVAAGKEPVLDADGRVVGYATGGGFGYTLGRSLVVASLEVGAATVGARLAIEIFGERVGATVLAEPALAPAWRR